MTFKNIIPLVSKEDWSAAMDSEVFRIFAQGQLQSQAHSHRSSVPWPGQDVEVKFCTKCGNKSSHPVCDECQNFIPDEDVIDDLELVASLEALEFEICKNADKLSQYKALQIKLASDSEYYKQVDKKFADTIMLLVLK